MTIDDKNAADDGLAPYVAAGPMDWRVAIVVCSSCRDAVGSDARPRPGEMLGDDARQAAAGMPIRVDTVECLGNCSRRLSAAIVRHGAWSYVFGGLNAMSGADLVKGARLFAASQDGFMPWRGRPESLKRGLVARIPPLSFEQDIS